MCFYELYRYVDFTHGMVTISTYLLEKSPQRGKIGGFNSGERGCGEREEKDGGMCKKKIKQEEGDNNA
jgi:hypothetical protein